MRSNLPFKLMKFLICAAICCGPHATAHAAEKGQGDCSPLGSALKLDDETTVKSVPAFGLSTCRGTAALVSVTRRGKTIFARTLCLVEPEGRVCAKRKSSCRLVVSADSEDDKREVSYYVNVCLDVQN